MVIRSTNSYPRNEHFHDAPSSDFQDPTLDLETLMPTPSLFNHWYDKKDTRTLQNLEMHSETLAKPHVGTPTAHARHSFPLRCQPSIISQAKRRDLTGEDEDETVKDTLSLSFSWPQGHPRDAMSDARK